MPPIQGYPARSEQMQAKVAKRRLASVKLNKHFWIQYASIFNPTQPSNEANPHSNPAQKLPKGQKIL